LTALEDYVEEMDDEREMRLLGVKVTNIYRFFKVFLAFPFVVIISAIKPTGRYAFFRSLYVIRIMNMLIYIFPFVLVALVLEQFQNEYIQVVTVGAYIFIFLLPVAFVVFSKVDLVRSSTHIEEGTFCFKPARSVTISNQANFYQILGFLFEWLQHVLYVLPTGVLSSESEDDTGTEIQDYPPYAPFEAWFWFCVSCTFICVAILMLNAVLRGKTHYKFQKSKVVWYILFNVGSPMFVTIVTILFMGLDCDYTQEPPILVADKRIDCFSDQHIVIARAALISLAVYIVQHTLLPSGTFKETMGDDTLEIMFVPVYLQAHYFLKAIFCGVYVFFYEHNYTRIFILTLINFLLLWMNNSMKPCSIAWINTMRNGIFLHASLSGIQSVNYVFWPANSGTKNMLLSTLFCNIAFTSIGMIVLHYSNMKSTEHAISIAFLDLEWQVSHGGSVHPRVLEPLISLTLSTDEEDWDIVKKYIPQLVWLISYPNKRVQFQSTWTLANLSLLEEDARLKVHENEGTKVLLEWYMDMDDLVQLECLAALANLSLSYHIAHDMVVTHKCIPFFLSIANSTKLKHAQFSIVSLGNIARIEKFRHRMMAEGGMKILLDSIMQHDYLKMKFGCVALSNLMLSDFPRLRSALRVKGILERILKMALRNEVDTQTEVMALLRNISCYTDMRSALFQKGVLHVIEELSKVSAYTQDVEEWTQHLATTMDNYVHGRTRVDHEDSHSPSSNSATYYVHEADDEQALKSMTPLSAQVEWSTWGSKLDIIFAPVFANMPTITAERVTATSGIPQKIDLTKSIPKNVLLKWRGSICYEPIHPPPSHGKLSPFTESTSGIFTYTSDPGYMGHDFFQFKVKLGALDTIPATVNIDVIEHLAKKTLGDSSSDSDSDKSSNSSNSSSSSSSSSDSESSSSSSDGKSAASDNTLERPRAQVAAHQHHKHHHHDKNKKHHHKNKKNGRETAIFDIESGLQRASAQSTGGSSSNTSNSNTNLGAELWRDDIPWDKANKDESEAVSSEALSVLKKMNRGSLSNRMMEELQKSSEFQGLEEEKASSVRRRSMNAQGKVPLGSNIDDDSSVDSEESTPLNNNKPPPPPAKKKDKKGKSVRL
jgi:hypothetical protein